MSDPCPHRWTSWMLKQVTVSATVNPVYVSCRTCLACGHEQLSHREPTPTRLRGILIGIALFILSAALTTLLLVSFIPA